MEKQWVLKLLDKILLMKDCSIADLQLTTTILIHKNERLDEDIEKFLEENPTVSKEDIPSDIITASGSGLDPHISVEAAKVQMDRVAKNTGLSQEQLEKMIEENTSGKFLGIFGEETVNVLKLNLMVAQEIDMI